MINKMLNKLCGYYIKYYKKMLKSGKETMPKEDIIFAYCVLELNKEEK